MNPIKFTLFMFLAFIQFSLKAQTEKPTVSKTDLPVILLSENVSLHIISPEPVQFVDLSSDVLTGDLPAENIARIKITDNSNEEEGSYQIPNELGIVTVVAQSFISQYRVIFSGERSIQTVTNLQIQPENMQPLDHTVTSLSTTELKRFSNILLNKKTKRPIRKESNLKMTMQLNNVYVRDDYVFLDLTLINKSNLNYDIDKTLFSVEDKRVYKATNNQSIQLNPVFKYYQHKGFRRTYRNIYVFKKFTYPNSKVLTIRIAEKQISGRTIEMNIKFSDILKADTF